MDKKEQQRLDNNSKVSNPEHKGSGPGRPAAFGGDEKDADNHGNQLNPNNEKYQAPKSEKWRCQLNVDDFFLVKMNSI